MPQRSGGASDRWWIWPVLLAALPSGLAAAVVAALLQPGHGVWSPGLLASTTATGLVGGVLAGLRPRYVGGWLMLATGVAFLVGQWCEVVTVVGSADDAPVTLWIANWIYPPALVPLFVLLPLTFPDGHLPSRRWRPVAILAVLVAGLLALNGAFAQPTLSGPDGRYPNRYAVPELTGLDLVGNVLGLVTLALSLAGVASLVLRYRAASDQAREQILWVTVACLVLVAAFALDAAVALLAPSAYPAVFPVIQLAPIVVPASVAIAILRHHLFDIRVVAGRLLVYGGLTIGLLGAYAVTALGLARALPGSTELGRLTATAVVALAFAPLRGWLQDKLAHRLFGDRAEPYAALVRLSREVAGSSAAPERVLTALADSTAAALRSPWVAVELAAGDRVVANSQAGKRPPDGSAVTVLELTHAGDQVGRLVVAGRSHDSFTSADLRLLTDLALPIGAALHAVRLSMDLRASRERIVTSVEDERRRTGRDLHDSLGPRLAAIGMTVETAAELVDTDPQATRRLLSVLLEQTSTAVNEVRQLAHTQRPPALDVLGLVGALEAHLALVSPVDARLIIHGEPPKALPAAVEIAAYRIVLEAVTNVTRHADAGTCIVTLTNESEELVVEVSDDGRGFAADSRQGLGLPSMRERAEALGGQFHVGSRPDGAGTLIRATLPYAPASNPPVQRVEQART
jgi:signal transduction histidine kinase